MFENLGDWAVHFGVYILDETAQGKIEKNNFVDMLEGGDWRLPLDYQILKPPRSLRPSPIDFATLFNRGRHFIKGSIGFCLCRRSQLIRQNLFLDKLIFGHFWKDLVTFTGRETFPYVFLLLLMNLAVGLTLDLFFWDCCLPLPGKPCSKLLLALLLKIFSKSPLSFCSSVS